MLEKAFTEQDGWFKGEWLVGCPACSIQRENT